MTDVYMSMNSNMSQLFYVKVQCDVKSNYYFVIMYVSVRCDAAQVSVQAVTVMMGALCNGDL